MSGAGGSPNLADVIRHAVSAAIVLAALVQIVIGPGMANVFAAVVSAAIGIVVIQYVVRRKGFVRFPISSMMMLGLNVSGTTGPLVFQSLAGREVTYNILMPVQTFGLAAGVAALAVAVHALYRNLAPVQRARAEISRALFGRIGLMTTPSAIQLWIMGFVGLACLWSVGRPAATVEYGDSGGKLLAALTPLATAPFLIPLLPYLFCHRGRPGARSSLMLLGYFGLVVGVAVACNSRAAFAMVIVVAGLCLAIALSSGRMTLTRRGLIVGVAVVALGLPTMTVLLDVSTAMLIARANRGEASSSDLVRTSIAVFDNKPVLHAFRERSAIVGSGYNEVYIDNAFVQRSTTIKYLDLNLYQSRDLSPDQVETARAVAGDRALSILPTPVIAALGIDFDKAQVAYSGGDLYRFLSGRGPVGGFTTGSALADGLVVFGPLFWPIFAAFAFASFFLHDLFSVSSAGRLAFVSPSVLMSVHTLFTAGLVGENVAGALGGLVRVYPQTILLYLLIFHASLIVSLPFRTRPAGAFRRSLAGAAR